LTVLKIICGILILAGIIWSVLSVNNYSEEKYHYKPFCIKNILLMFIPLGFILISTKFVEEGNTLAIAIMQGNLDVLILIFLAIGAFVYIFYTVMVKTKFLIALYVTTLLFVTDIVLIIVFLIHFALTYDPKDKKFR
jgi:hypothetical protein